MPHWAKGVLAQRGRLVPLDMLAGPAADTELARLDRLVMAQPRPLAPQENVALDDWVRKGGYLLLFADPLLSEDSAFPLGDPRRPQGTVLLSPILRHWGLELRFDDIRETPGEQQREVLGNLVPVNLAGHFAVLPGASCSLSGGGLAAVCRVGKGRVLAFADAAVLERADGNGQRARALSGLLDEAFDGS